MVNDWMQNKSLLFLIAVYFIFNLTLFVSAESNQTLDIQEAASCINNSVDIISEMNNSGFNIERVSEILKQAQSMYNSQLAVKERNSLNYDFSLVFSYCGEIKTIRELAFSSIESREVLLKFYQSSITPEMDVTEINKTLEEINNEIKSERYEKVDPLISKAYEQISSVIASYSKLRVVYLSASNSVLRFIYLNKWLLSVFFGFIILFWIIFHKTIKIYLIQRKINSLELRKNTVRGLIMKSQKEFFEKGSLSEGNYDVRTKKFGELILDIDRQIPFLKEELGRLVKIRKKDEKRKRI